MTTLITPGLVTLDDDLGPDKADVLRALAERLVAQGRATDADAVYADLLKREEKDSTGIPGGIAIPHARSAAVLEPTLVMSRLKPGVDFGAGDGPADLVFSIAVPDGADDAHLSLLSTLARSLIRPDFTQSLREATTPEQIVEIVGDVLDPKPAEAAPAAAPAAAAPAAASAEAPASGKTRIVAITACATGIAHTFMAADTLTMAAKNRDDVQLDVEPQGSSKVVPLDPAIVAAADAVIFAVDVDVREKHRFVGKPVIQVPVKRGIDAAEELLDRAIAATKDPNATRVTVDSSASSAAESGPAKKESVGARLKRWLMTGVSYMIPFVAGGGLLIALGFLLAGYEIPLKHDDASGLSNAAYTLLHYTLFNLPPEGLGYYLGAVAFTIGGASMGFLVPALAGYIAFGIADRPGIAPGFVAGAIALSMNAGFLGGLVGGLLAGWIAWYLSSLNPPKWLRGLMPVVIIPLIGSIVASGAMLLFLGGPIAALMKGLNDWLMGLSGTGAVALGIILGLMMCFDLGGPVNKVAYSFAVAGLGAGSLVDNPVPLQIMATVMAAGMVPPIAVSIATFIAPKLFSPLEHENGKSAWLLGLAFISEGAIPFAAGDPLRVIPASMVGGALTGALTMAMGVTSQAPHGGLFVFFAIGNLFGFVISILAGSIVTALVLVALKKWARKPAAPAETEAAAVEAVAA